MKIGRVAIAHPSGRRGTVTEIASALDRLGIERVMVEDGDPRGLKTDLLVMAGSYRAFLHYPRKLARAARRPLTAVWQIETLPPAELDRSTEEMPIWALLDNNRSRVTRGIIKTLLYPILALQLARAARRTGGRGRYDFTARNLELPLQSFLMIRAAKQRGWLDHIFVSTLLKKQFLESRGIDATFAPFGIHPRSGENRHGARDIDVLFLGEMKGRRREKLDRLESALEPHGIELMVIDRDCYGEKRTAILNRTKILLHLHNFEWDTPWTRWMTATACGCAIVSEQLAQSAPFVAGVHHAEAPLEKLPDEILKWLGDDEGRQRMAEACAAFTYENLTLEQSVTRVIDWAEAKLEAGSQRGGTDAGHARTNG